MLLKRTQLLTFVVVMDHPPKKRSPLGFRWSTSHRNDTCRQEGHIWVNCSVHTTQPKPSNEVTNHSRPRRGGGSREQVINDDRDIQWWRFMGPRVWYWLFCFLFLFCFGLFFLQSKPSADNDKHEGEIKIYIQTKKWGFQDKKQKTQKQDRTTQSRKPRQSTD